MRTNHGSNRKRDILKLYDSTAPFYNRRYRQIQYRKYNQIGNIFLEKGKTLDVGCGTGLLLCLLGNKAGLLVGVDTSRRMLRIATRAMRRKSVKSDLVRADAESLPFRDDIFTTVTSFTVLQNLSEPKDAIGEIARVAVSGGKIALSCLKKRCEINELKKAVKESACPDLEITMEWDNNEEDIGINIVKIS